MFRIVLVLLPAVRLLLLVCQVALSHFSVVSSPPISPASLWQPTAAQVRSCLFDRRHSLVPPLPGLPTLYRKRLRVFQSPLYLSCDKNEEMSSLPDMSQELGPCCSLCAIAAPTDVWCILQPQTTRHVAMTVLYLPFIPETPPLRR